MPSQTKQNYLKAIYFLASEDGKFSLSGLSKSMDVSAPTANSMVKKMQEAGWVIYKKYQPLELTASGKTAAALIVRKHRLTEMFLVERMDFGWESVHDIAEEMEHIDSELLFDRMDEMLGHPTIDPHGSPIPDKTGKIVARDYVRMSEVQAECKVRLCALSNTSNDFLIYLNAKGLELGTHLQVLHIEPFDQSITVAYADHSSVMLSHEVCERLLVEVVD